MKFFLSRAGLPDLLLIEHERVGDSRGFFAEVFREDAFRGLGLPAFVQENHSRSSRGVLRGLHYQLHPMAQGKLVRCLRGAVFDVAVDLRRRSGHYGQWAAFELNEGNGRMLYLPPGFAHGFYTLSELADVVYRQTEYYSPEHERGIRWDDPRLGIAWPLQAPPLLSLKDSGYPAWSQAEHDF